jgi:hypothetical protein
MGPGARFSAAGTAALFVSVGVLFFLRGRQVGSADYMDPETLNDWLAVVGFSVALICLAIALPVYAGLTGERTTYKTSFVSATGSALGGVSNLLEDGLAWSWAFWFFVVSTLLINVGLLALTLVMAWKAQGLGRLLAAVPAGSLLGVLLFELVGGLLMLVAWSAAALVAVRPPHGVPEG